MGAFSGIILWIWVALVIFLVVDYGDGYREGQISCINGKIEYALVLNPDNSTKWIKIAK